MTHLHYVVSFEMIFPEFDGNNKLHDLFYNDKNATYVYLTGSKFSFIALIFQVTSKVERLQSFVLLYV